MTSADTPIHLRNFRVLWEFEGEDYGEGRRRAERIHGGLYPPFSVAYFCPTCGRIWARACVTDNQRWRVSVSPCERHGPGSIRLPRDEEQTLGASREMALRELSIIERDVQQLDT